jgi:arsenical pump membrane protein
VIIAICIFLITIILIVWQPKGLSIGIITTTGALFSLISGCVDFQDILEVTNIVWDATLAFIGIIILSIVLDKIGFFEWCAIYIAIFAKGNGHIMFIYSLILGAIVSALFANDGAALILTPILLSKMKILKLNIKTIIAFLLAGGFISDATSLPFIFSNLTNIITADYFHIGFIQYFNNMIIPFFVSTVASIIVLYILLYKDLTKSINTNLLKNPNSVLKSKTLFYFSWFFLILLLIGYIISDIYFIPVSFFALGGGLIFLWIASIAKAVNYKEIISKTPWHIISFSIGLYIIVYGLKNAGLTDIISDFIKSFSQYGTTIHIISTGFISGMLSSVMNNLPTVMIMDIALKHIPNDILIYANIIGVNIGAKLTPFGSLSTLLWLHILSNKGIKISYWQYMKFSFIVTPIILLIVLLSISY